VTTTVVSVGELTAAVGRANSQGGGETILIADGTYTLTAPLQILAPNITVRSQSGNRGAVILQGDAMSASASVKEIFWVNADNFTVEDLTMRRVGWHLIQVAGENDADFTVIRNCVLQDAYEQMVKITYSPSDPTVGSNGGLIEGSVFEYTAGIGPQYYIGGVDGHQATDWIIRGNTFRDIASPSTAVAEHAVHFWSNSSGTIVEGNTIIDSDRGIGFGLEAGRGHVGGIIRNNMISHANNGDSFADTGIALAYSPGTLVLNNSVYFGNEFPWAIEYRFPETSTVVIRNNLTNKPIQLRDGASGTVNTNVTNAVSSWFVNSAAGDLHLLDLTATRVSVIDRGVAVSEVTTDLDGDMRPSGVAYDVGADELLVGDIVPPVAPTSLAVE
jgi:hypothetical protein